MIEQILCFLVLIICLVYGLALLSWLVMKLDIEKRRSKRTKFFEMIGGTLMEIEKLKDMLRNAAGGPVGIQMCQEAADALEQLQAENDRLRRERNEAVECCSGYCTSCCFEHDCAKHDMNDAAPTRWYYGDCEDWEWQGVKEE